MDDVMMEDADGVMLQSVMLKEGVVEMKLVDLTAGMASFRNPNLTPKQRGLAAEKEKERIWRAFLEWNAKSLMPYDEANIKGWIELQVFNDCVQRNDWCPRCSKWTRGTSGCGTAGCTAGEYMLEYHICNIPRCVHYLHDKQESDPDGTRRCFEHHLI